MSRRRSIISARPVVGPDALRNGGDPVAPCVSPDRETAGTTDTDCLLGHAHANSRGHATQHRGHQIHEESTEAARNVLRTLIFYDLFGCPLRIDELPQRTIGGLPDAWVANPRTRIEADPVLARHVRIARGYVFLRTTQPRFEQWEQAERTRWQCVRRYEKWVRLFCRIPFVRMVAVTGSLSFPMPTKEPDCDLFIVAARNRLWLVVALSRLVFFRILPRLRLVKYGEVCPNYSIDESAVTRLAADLFDSLQVAAMNPVMGQEIHANLVRSHRGLRRYFPHWKPPAPLFTCRSHPRIVRRLIEAMMEPLPLDWLNRRLFRALARRFAAARTCVNGTPEDTPRPISSPWILDAFDCDDKGIELSINACKVHGHGKRALLARYDRALRNHPASRVIDLPGQGVRQIHE